MITNQTKQRTGIKFIGFYIFLVDLDTGKIEQINMKTGTVVDLSIKNLAASDFKNMGFEMILETPLDLTNIKPERGM